MERDESDAAERLERRRAEAARLGPDDELPAVDDTGAPPDENPQLDDV